MKIYIDKTETTWIDYGSKDSPYEVDLMKEGFFTTYRICFVGTDVIKGTFTHYKDMTFEEKERHVKEILIKGIKE